MRRILVVESSGQLYGSERALLDVLKSLSNVEVAVCCPPDQPLNVELEKREIRMLDYFIARTHEQSRWRRLAASLGVLRACLEFRPDLIYLNQSGCFRVVLPSAIILNVPIVAHVRLYEDAEYLFRAARRSKHLRGVVAISESIAEQLRPLEGAHGPKIRRIYDSYIPYEATPAGQRELNRIACVARVVPSKGHETLVRAIGVSEDLKDKIECYMVGAGEATFTRQLQDLCFKSNISSRIRWLGFVDPVAPILQTCVALVLPTSREGLGRVIFDAWQAGAIPIVFSGSGGAAEVVAASQGGILYNEQTPESLATALRSTLLLSDTERGILVDNGRTWLARECNSAEYGKAISELFDYACRR